MKEKPKKGFNRSALTTAPGKRDHLETVSLWDVQRHDKYELGLVCCKCFLLTQKHLWKVICLNSTKVITEIMTMMKIVK